jgi:hypothetical protein
MLLIFCILICMFVYACINIYEYLYIHTYAGILPLLEPSLQLNANIYENMF